MLRLQKHTGNLGKIALLSILSGLVAACSGNSYVETRDIEPSYEEITTEHEFAIALQDAYFDIATRAYDAGDTASADYYALRSIMAAEGKIVQPASVPVQQMGGDFATANGVRKRLMAEFDSGARLNTPRLAAQAQASLDCWLREAAQDLSRQRTDACKFESLDVIQQVEANNIQGAQRVASARPFVQTQIDAGSIETGDTLPSEQIAQEEPVTTERVIAATGSGFDDKKSVKTVSLQDDGDVTYISPLVRATMPRSGDYALYFGFDSSEITMEAEDILIDVVQEAKNRDVKKLVIMGHTDTIGPSRYNKLLSLRRAQEVRKFLAEQLPEDISYSVAALGETSPIIGVGNSIAQTANRRVEVTFE